MERDFADNSTVAAVLRGGWGLKEPILDEPRLTEPNRAQPSPTASQPSFGTENAHTLLGIRLGFRPAPTHLRRRTYAISLESGPGAGPGAAL